MRPLIFEYLENPKILNIDASEIEYSRKMNLSVIKNTNFAAIQYAKLHTETFSKGDNETSDSDLNYNLKHTFETSTETFTSSEPTDSDDKLKEIGLLMHTKTVTETIESTDSDK